MAGVQENLIIAPADWCAITERLVSLELCGATLEDIKAQVARGAALFKVLARGDIVGAFVLRVDELAGRNEGVVVAAGGNLPGVDLTAVCMPQIETRFTGCSKVRAHTGRPAVARKLMREGYRVREIVLEKDIA